PAWMRVITSLSNRRPALIVSDELCGFAMWRATLHQGNPWDHYIAGPRPSAGAGPSAASVDAAYTMTSTKAAGTYLTELRKDLSKRWKNSEKILMNESLSACWP